MAADGAFALGDGVIESRLIGAIGAAGDEDWPKAMVTGGGQEKNLWADLEIAMSENGQAEH